MKEIVVACVRVALKDPNKLVDEQTKDFWKWRDTILYSEDVLLESLAFDMNIQAPQHIMYPMLSYYRLEHNKRLRNAAWAFLTDSYTTQLCLLFSSRTIAAASLYAGARLAEVELPDEDGKPWWELQYVKLRDIRRACNMMADIYEEVRNKEGVSNIYAGLRSPEDGNYFDTPTPGQHPMPEPELEMEIDRVSANGNGNGAEHEKENGNGGDEVMSEEGELDG